MRKSKPLTSIPPKTVNIEKCKAELQENWQALHAKDVAPSVKSKLLKECLEKTAVKLKPKKRKKKKDGKTWFTQHHREMRKRVMKALAEVKKKGISNANYVMLRDSYHKSLRNVEDQYNENKALELIEEAVDKGLKHSTPT